LPFLTLKMNDSGLGNKHFLKPDEKVGFTTWGSKSVDAGRKGSNNGPYLHQRGSDSKNPYQESSK
jgi:hypothetical protein